METRDYENDCEAIFREDVIEKKITGRGAFGKTTCTRKRNGGMPSDFLRGKKLREYMGNSEVKTYNLKDVAIPRKTRKARTKITPAIEESICSSYLSGNSNKSIVDAFGITVPTLYNILTRKGIDKKTVKRTEVKPVDDVQCGSVSWELQSDCETEPAEIVEPELTGFEDMCEHFNYKQAFELSEKRCAVLKEENEKYRVALLNLATRMI